jgi:hypothetical protein
MTRTTYGARDCPRTRTDPPVELVDPFDLPEWLGTSRVTWTATSSVRGAQRIEGTLSSPEAGGDLPCDLMAVDVAYPQPLLSDPWRRQAHQAWEHGQVLLVTCHGRLTLAVPGTAYSADGVLESIGRLAKAVGAKPEAFVVTLRL